MTDVADGAGTRRRVPPRSHSNFAARTARDDAAQLDRNSTVFPSPSNEETPLLAQYARLHTQDGTQGAGPAQERDHGTDSMRGWFSRAWRSALFHHNDDSPESKRAQSAKPRPGAFPRPVGGTTKLGTFNGVFVPVTLNVLSILMFLRFGFILGQAGVLGMLGMLISCYAINLLTTMSISAIATNGTVRGGGAYYLISRSLGPEFGGSIGIVFYLGMVFNTSLNAVGLIDCFIDNFGLHDGSWAHWMRQGFWWQYIWATLVLIACTCICLAGSGIFARCSNGLLVILLLATFSIPFSAFVVSPFENRTQGIRYTGLSWDTFRGNLMPRFTRGAAGSQINGKENFQDLFGILFPATGGIFAGASMSGDLKHPSKAIPKGTLSGLALTFFSYAIVILAMAATTTRASFVNNTNVIQLTNLSGVVILLGEFATSAFSVLMGVIGSAKLLQALARDHLIPGLSIFGQGTRKSDDPTYAIFLTYLLAQLTMLSDINQIASFITMTYLMTFLVTNLACFLLKIGSAPNFRPSFHFFNWQTAAIGAVASGATMFFVDGIYASGCVALLMVIFLLIHYTTPPKPWGDVSQSLIYHQVRKYLLRLRQEHVKFWRPQILLIVNDPRRQYKLIQFCNSLKKGALFVLGHVIVSQDFASAVPEVRRQQQAWTKYIDFSRIKAFINIVISPAVEWGARNIVLAAGLGGMRPNIVVMGFYNLGELRDSRVVDVPSSQPSRPANKAQNPPTVQTVGAAANRRAPDRPASALPTDSIKLENALSIQSYVTIVEDLILRLQINVAIARGFQDLEVPTPKLSRRQKLLSVLGLGKPEEEPSKRYIDMWPIQMSAEIATAGDDPTQKSALTTNFDTYTLILQLGCILNTVPSWKRTYKLRVCVFVEYESDVEEERGRVTTLLRNLRIEAEVLVFWLASGELKMYEVIINGSQAEDCMQARTDANDALQEEEWWKDMQRLRQTGDISSSEELTNAKGLLERVNNWPAGNFQFGRTDSKPRRFAQLRNFVRRKHRTSVASVLEAGLKMGMRSQLLPAHFLSDSDSSSSEEGSDALDEAVHTDSEPATDNGLAEYDLDASDEEQSDSPSTGTGRARSTSATMGSVPFIGKRLSLRKSLFRDEQGYQKQRLEVGTPSSSRATVSASHTALLASKASPSISSASLSSGSKAAATPRPIRQQSMPKFTSKPHPLIAAAPEETAESSVMFVESPSAEAARKQDPMTAYIPVEPRPGITPAHASSPAPTMQTGQAGDGISQAQAQAQPATGYPLQSAIPLSFNDLPCRAQHLILNELIRQNSEDTAVVFTTLPSPVEGTCESETESVKYISDLEVLCLGLPPVLLVHSNSMTVTMNL
ncbi:uncharacterized protein EI97DRAFT_18802 [Westerdykella ornata]|uniref:Cation chloride cotransporter n=1 Tax=Westerdykella ornata TaxID=318751 RepID=A0A6A6JY78_WESOR|nr:uncharacterized protein EI97DRAFT_18802 [Westerdykella ornata]KAF2281043.1 hypothetical protein EI97DRAFT_18802 [Westerdykella ornata]